MKAQKMWTHSMKSRYGRSLFKKLVYGKALKFTCEICFFNALAWKIIYSKRDSEASTGGYSETGWHNQVRCFLLCCGHIWLDEFKLVLFQLFLGYQKIRDKISNLFVSIYFFLLCSELPTHGFCKWKVFFVLWHCVHKKLQSQVFEAWHESSVKWFFKKEERERFLDVQDPRAPLEAMQIDRKPEIC